MLQNIPQALFKYSQRSLQNLNTCHPDLQRLFLELSRTHDSSVICGFRSNADQEIAYATGHSQKKPGCGKHNHYPSMAVDVVPANAPKLWVQKEDLPVATYEGYAKDIFDLGRILGITNLVWGGHWITLKDYSHWELV